MQQDLTFFGRPWPAARPAGGAGEHLPAWLAARQLLWKRLAVGLALLLFVVDGIRVWGMTTGDFMLHHGFAQRFVWGTFMYEDGVHLPYPPVWGMAFVPLCFFSLHVARVIAYPTTYLALALLLWVLHRLTRERLPLGRDALFWSTAAALALGARFVEREMQDCGPNMVLVALTWLGIYFWTRGRERQGAACMGLAIGLKCTAAVFIGYFLLKRQWRMAALSAGCALLVLLAPLLWMVPQDYLLHMHTWIGNVLHGLRQPDPSWGILGQEKVQNLSLRTALARYLIHLEPGHVARLHHPLYVEFLNLPHALAGGLIRLVTLGFVGALAWTMRGRLEERRDLRTLWECAAVSLVGLLLSPITWEQHCVAAVPALYLLMRTAWARGGLPGWIRRVLAAYVVLVLVLNRDLVGMSLSYLLLSYHVITWCLIALLAACLALARRELPAVASA